MGYWNSKVLPRIKRAFAFERNGNRKAAVDACKSFDDSKEEINKDFDENKTNLQPKVIEVYEGSSTEIKDLVKEPTHEGLTKSPEAVQTFLEELVKTEFPGSKEVFEASSKFGPVLVSGPILFVLEKVSTLVITEEKPAATATATAEIAAPAATEADTHAETTTTKPQTTEEAINVKDKEIAIEEVKKEEEQEVVKVTEPAAAPQVEETKTVKTDEIASAALSKPPKAEEPPVHSKP